MTPLRDRVLEHVANHPGETVDDIARAVRARTADVRDVLLSGDFQATQRAAYPSDRALVYSVAVEAGDGRGRAHRPSQADRVAAVLRDGAWHTAAEIHRRCGFMRLNSRISELRSRRGMTIVCEHVAGADPGPDAYRYRLVGTSEEAARDARDVGETVGHPAVSSDVSKGAEVVDAAERPGAVEAAEVSGHEASVQLEIGAAA